MQMQVCVKIELTRDNIITHKTMEHLPFVSPKDNALSDYTQGYPVVASINYLNYLP